MLDSAAIDLIDLRVAALTRPLPEKLHRTLNGIAEEGQRRGMYRSGSHVGQAGHAKVAHFQEWADAVFAAHEEYRVAAGLDIDEELLKALVANVEKHVTAKAVELEQSQKQLAANILGRSGSKLALNLSVATIIADKTSEWRLRALEAETRKRQTRELLGQLRAAFEVEASREPLHGKQLLEVVEKAKAEAEKAHPDKSVLREAVMRLGALARAAGSANDVIELTQKLAALLGLSP